MYEISEFSFFTICVYQIPRDLSLRHITALSTQRKTAAVSRKNRVNLIGEQEFLMRVLSQHFSSQVLAHNKKEKENAS